MIWGTEDKTICETQITTIVIIWYTADRQINPAVTYTQSINIHMDLWINVDFWNGGVGEIYPWTTNPHVCIGLWTDRNSQSSILQVIAYKVNYSAIDMSLNVTHHLSVSQINGQHEHHRVHDVIAKCLENAESREL